MKYIKLFEEYSRIEININELANVIAKQLKYEGAEYIDSGASGVVYSISDTLILKITNSSQEAKIARDMIGLNLEYITNTYKVFKTNSDKYKIIGSKLRLPYYEDIFCIIGERCFVDNNKIPKIICDIQNIMVDAGIKFNAHNFFKVILNENILMKIQKYLSTMVLSPFLFLKSKEEYFKYYNDCVNIAKEMKRYNINNIDGHAWNFGIKNDHLCIFDILNKTKYKDDFENIKLESLYINFNI